MKEDNGSGYETATEVKQIKEHQANMDAFRTEAEGGVIIIGARKADPMTDASKDAAIL